MFGNHPLPNIAPSLLLFLPPPPHTFPPLPPPPSPLQPPTWAKRRRAHHWCQWSPTMPRHHLSTVPTSATLLPPLPSLRDVGKWHLLCHPPLTNSPGHCQMPHHPLSNAMASTLTTACATSPDKSTRRWMPHHVIKTEGARRIAKGVQGGRKRGKEKERGNRRWGGGCLCPLPPAASFGQRGSVHPTCCLIWPSRCEWGSVQPTHHLIRPSRHEWAMCNPHTALFKLLYPPHHWGGFFPTMAKMR